MSAHTPGPWQAVGPPDNIHVVRADAPHMRICFLTSDGPTEANADLIIAAPDLLAALREVAELQGSAHAPAGSLWSRVNAAIAKATGVDDLDARQSEIARARALYDKCDKP